MKLKFNWVPFLLSFAAIMGLRIYQILSIGNAAVRMQWDNFEMICFVLAAAAFVLTTVMSYLSKDAPNVFVINRNLSVGLITVVTAVFAVWSSVYEIKDYLNSQEDWAKLLSGVLGILAGVVFILIALTFIKEKNYFEKRHLLVLIPTLWATAKLLIIFFEYNDIPTNIFNVSNSLSKIFLLFFLFAQARLFSGLFNATTFKKLFYFGLSAVLFMSVSLTNHLASVMDAGQKLSLANLVAIAAEVFLMFYTMSSIFIVKTGEIAVEEDVTVAEVSNNNISAETTENNNSEAAEDNEESTDMAKVDRLIEDIKNETANSAQDSLN